MATLEYNKCKHARFLYFFLSFSLSTPSTTNKHHMQDSFFNQDLFIRLSWAIFFKGHHNGSFEMRQYYTEINNLINTTSLNNQILIHSLYYLYLLVHHKTSLFNSTSPNNHPSFSSTSRTKLLSGETRRNSKELKELIIVLLMIANKSLDDSSYTMKTWENLTSLSLLILKKREITILKKINYNVFLAIQNYSKWIDSVHNQCLKFGLIADSFSPKSALYTSKSNNNIYSSIPPSATTSIPINGPYPLTPKSPLSGINHQQQSAYKRSFDNDSFLQSSKRQKLGQYPSNSVPSSHLLTPVKSILFQQQQPPISNDILVDFPPLQQLAPHVMPHTDSYQESINNQLFDPLNFKKLSSYLEPNMGSEQGGKAQDEKSYEYLNDTHIQHPLNCACCAMTNFANELSYSSGTKYAGGSMMMMRSML